MANEPAGYVRYASMLPWIALGVVVLFIIVNYNVAGAGNAYLWLTTNSIYVLVLILFIALLYFYNKTKAGVRWRDAKFCLREAVNKGYLLLPAGFSTFSDLWATVYPPNQLDSDGTWLFTGQFFRRGKVSSVKVDGTRGEYWVRNGFENEVFYGHVNIQTMERKRLTLEQKEAELMSTRVEKLLEKEKEEVEG